MHARPLTEADLPRAVALSARAGWNQVAADWQVFLARGAVRVLDDDDPECLAATAAVLPFDADLAWISMVLVRPDRRRQGLATTLLRWALERLEGTRCIALDATPEGREVYGRLGFADALRFARWRVATLPERGGQIETCTDPRLLHAADLHAFGTSRDWLLDGFVRRLPEAALVARDGSFALGRDGLRAPQIGPIVARDPDTSLALIGAASHAIGRPALLDLADDASDVAAGVAAAGGERLRPFIRMTRGAHLPGNPALMVAMAGPEFG